MTPAKPQLGRAEFIALTAMLMAMVALSIDAMLPALPAIAHDLSPAAPERTQLVVTSLILGMGIGTLFTGPMSDAWGRKPVMIAGAALYALGAGMAALAPSLEWLLAARLVQGLGAAGARVVVMALVRDLYSGRQMAQILSFGGMIFSLVPAIAPSLGAAIALWAGWRAIFVAFIAFAGLVSLWLALRQPETLPPAARRPLRPALLWAALAETLRHPVARRCILGLMLAQGMLFATLSSTQGVFDQTFGRGAEFPLWFMLVAVLGAGAGFLNGWLVPRLGMRFMALRAYQGLLLLTLVMAALLISNAPQAIVFAGYLSWITAIFVMMGLTMGNLSSLMLAPLGHIAGLAASVAAAVSTVGAVVIAVPIGLSFDGTPLPIALAIAAVAALSVAVVRGLPPEVRLTRPD